MAENDANTEYYFVVCCCCGTPIDETVQRLEYCALCLALLCADCRRHHVCGEGAVDVC
jgi:hypothetical protein